MTRLALHINLLDWRAAEREHKRKRFIAQLTAAAVATIILVGVLPVLYYGQRLDTQRARNQYLQNQIDIAAQQLSEIRALKQTRRDLVDRMRVIGRLQHSRSAIVHYFDQLSATIPEGVALTALEQTEMTTTLNGVAESNARVSQYMTNLDRSAWFNNPRLIVIKRNDRGGQRRADFTLKVDSVLPKADPALSGPAKSKHAT